MILAAFYERAINAPGPTAVRFTLAVAGLLVVVGTPLSLYKPRWLGRGLGLVGLCMLMAALWAVREQTHTERLGTRITLTRYRYTERTRLAATLALVVVPCAAVTVMWTAYATAQYRLRSQVPRHLKAGKRLYAQKDFDSALREYNHALAAAPELAEAYWRRGLVYRELGKTSEALTDLDSAIEHDPRLSSAYLERGKMRTLAGDLDGAMSDFGHLMLIRANDPDSYLQRGVCLVKKGLLSDAVADFHRVLKLTHHSDYAEHAKNYLRQVLENQPAAPRAVFPNGSAVLPPSPSHGPAQDQTI